MQVKICGARTAADGAAIAAAGADFVGLNFVGWSSRCVSVEQARAVIAAAPGVTPVGVFMDHPVAEVQALARALNLRWVQLHGAEAPEACAALAGEFQVVKALTVDRLATHAEAFAPHVAAFLVDGRQPGSGQAWDWARLASLRPATPVWLAGGLTADNVAAAAAAVQPAAVDTASGVEVGGVVDPARVAAFCRAARGPEVRTR
ncbi:MAG: phosphoribosylanthranilate isomerase [Myxococcales bacterium]|nr:phosphoribosylanthranilate isomerase [Myxococcales bacterium]MCB9522180.1 phosphoribosylanthranilate isomerase [Myxococcales bacterium]